jgi:uncharacterized protein YjhX (UPF0386 family)
MPVSYANGERIDLLNRQLDAAQLAIDTCRRLLDDLMLDPDLQVEGGHRIVVTGHTQTPAQREVAAAEPAPPSRQLKAPRARKEKISITVARQNSARMKQELAAYLDKHKNQVKASDFFETLQAHGMSDLKKGSIHTLFYTLKGKKLMKSNGDGSYTVNDSQKEKIRGQAEEQEKAAAAVA